MIAIIKLILRMWDLINSIIAGYKARDAANWDKLIQKDVENYAALVTSKTIEERKSAEKNVAGDWLRK